MLIDQIWGYWSFDVVSARGSQENKSIHNKNDEGFYGYNTIFPTQVFLFDCENFKVHWASIGFSFMSVITTPRELRNVVGGVMIFSCL